MTCRHAFGDKACSTYEARMANLAADYEKYVAPKTPDKVKFEIEDIEEIGTLLLVKVRYPSCKDCAYEGVKVMLFDMVTIKDAIRWREIDPHFRDYGGDRTRAPSPIAKFPGDADGWTRAKQYAEWMTS